MDYVDFVKIDRPTSIRQVSQYKYHLIPKFACSSEFDYTSPPPSLLLKSKMIHRNYTFSIAPIEIGY